VVVMVGVMAATHAVAAAFVEGRAGVRMAVAQEVVEGVHDAKLLYRSIVSKDIS
jgi:hypothetical protein